MMMNSQSQKIDLHLGDLSINIDPILLRTFVSLSQSIKKQQEVRVVEIERVFVFQTLIFRRRKKRKKKKMSILKPSSSLNHSKIIHSGIFKVNRLISEDGNDLSTIE